jgi:exopolysaccharide production protein ExoZ
MASIGKIVGLQYGRAVAALTVVVAHAFAHPLPSPPDLSWYLGRVGVTIFFAISGFIMVQSVGPGTFNPLNFMKKRILRIVPLYYFVTLVVAIGALAAPGLFKNTVFDLQHIAASLLFIPTYRPANMMIEPFVKLGWTLNYEMFFYVIFASLCFLGARGRVLAVTALFIGLVVIGRFVSTDNALVRFYTGYDLLGFLGGLWLGLWSLSGRRIPGAMGSVMIAAAGIVGLVAGWMAYGDASPTLVRQVLVVAASTCIIAAVVFGEPWLRQARVGVLVFLGDASYSIYLAHMFALGAAYVLFTRTGLSELYPVAAVGGLVAGIASGCALYLLVEKPVIKWSRSPLFVATPIPVTQPNKD